MELQLMTSLPSWVGMFRLGRRKNVLTDDRIDTQREISFACPEQWDGQLTTGEFFYFRYRYGVAALYLSWTEMPRGADKADAYDSVSVGDGFAGIFADSEQRNSVFTALLDRLDAPAGFDRTTYGV